MACFIAIQTDGGEAALRDTLTVLFGPGLFCGIALGDWLKLLYDNRFAISPICWPKAATISAASVANSVCSWYEKWRYVPQVRQVAVQPPIFVLGHWRSGTTHLHNLLSVDERFAYPNLYQVLFPHTFLCSEKLVSRLLSPMLPTTRLFDNVKLAFDVPAEEEFAICNSTFLSCYMSITFPRREQFYDRFLTMRDVSADELEKWRGALLLFMQKLTWRFGKPIILKSPPHTCRIRLLLEMFPEARFVHIHREPYTVFQSTKHMILGWDRSYRLQIRDFSTLDERIIRQYREMYDIFFEERQSIPAGRYYEIGFEDLERDPFGELRKLYDGLGLPDFAKVESELRKYSESLSGYKKNVHREMDPALKQKLAVEWRRCFDEWGYAV